MPLKILPEEEHQVLVQQLKSVIMNEPTEHFDLFYAAVACVLMCYMNSGRDEHPFKKHRTGIQTHAKGVIDDKVLPLIDAKEVWDEELNVILADLLRWAVETMSISSRTAFLAKSLDLPQEFFAQPAS